MDNYGLIFKKITEDGRTFFVENNYKSPARVLMTVYNTYLSFPEMSREIVFEKNVEYWNYVVNNSKNRYVEFIDLETNKTVGLFGLDGEIDLKDYDKNGYLKKIFNNLNNEKGNIVFVFNEIVCQNLYSNDFLEVSANDVVLDIGFNFGLFSIHSSLRNAKRIIGFEPNTRLVKTFLENYGSNEIEVHNLAVSNMNGKVKFFENIDSGMSTIKNEFPSENKINEYEIDAIHINTIFEKYNLDYVDYLKVDCEGSEFDIFESMDENFLSNKISKIAIECHDYFESIKVQNLKSKLENCGFVLSHKFDEVIPLGMIYAKK